MNKNSNLAEIGQEILSAARNELYMNMPYLDAAFCSLKPLPGDNLTLSLATDGEKLYFNGGWLAERYMRSSALVCRAYFHVVLHCMLRHLSKKRGRVPELWDLACDVSVESILDSLEYRCLNTGDSPLRRKFYGECKNEMRTLTAEGAYRYLMKLGLSEYETARLQKAFLVDDHGLWSPEQKDSRERERRQDEKWRDVSEKARTAMETIMSGQAAGADALTEQVKAAVRDEVDYRAFLMRFAAPREIMSVDGDAFDYIFYTYGLELYGNMPLIEPPETREAKRIEDFVIAIDTSMSTSGELVREFLACTYAILRSTETFTRKVNIRIIQCDDQIRKDTRIRDLEDLKTYMGHFELTGGSATDFRPVFAHVDRLRGEGVFRSLRGLIYFTDGMGTYPKKRPAYDTAFVLLGEPPISVKMPAWCIKLVLDMLELERTQKELDALWPSASGGDGSE